MTLETYVARAPAKVILFGEHAINRGQPAVAAAVGLHATCRITAAPQYSFKSAMRLQTATRSSIVALGNKIEASRTAQDYEAIREIAAQDYFAPQKYVLYSALGDALPDGFALEWESEVPSSSGLGSGGSAFTAMVVALSRTMGKCPSLQVMADWAQRGDIVAHGGIASGLDTQTSLLGGVIRYTGQGLAEQVDCAPGMALLIANTGIAAATREVNTRVRLWLAENPEERMKYFEAIGTLAKAATPWMRQGNWEEVGRLMTLNQLVLERIGVSCPEIDRLVSAALNAGAYGAKISGSGGGGIVIALTPPEKKDKVAAALGKVGAQVLAPSVAVAGAIHSP